MKNSRVPRRSPRESINISDCNFDNIEYHRRSPIRQENEDSCSIVSKLVSSAFVHALDALIAALLSPIIMWQWLYKHDHLMIILRVVIEVILELIMLIVFAGVSILTASALIFEEAYSEKSQIPRNLTSEAHACDDRGTRIPEKPALPSRRSYSTTADDKSHHSNIRCSSNIVTS